MISKIRSREDIADGTMMVELDVSPSPSFKPGQYITLALVNPPHTDEKGIMRAFSIINSPSQKNTLAFATRKSDSAFKRSLEELTPGTRVDVKFIGGSFLLPKSSDKKIVMIAGGIGITPFISMLRHATETELPHNITLLYSNRTQSSTAFFEELNRLEKANPHLSIIFTMTDDPQWDGENRPISELLIKEYLPDYADSFFMIVGPGPLVSAMTAMLLKLGVYKENILVESFSGYQNRNI
jgi:ferredoxin-NADP reductase